MKVICTQENLKSGVQAVVRIVSNSATLPILNGVMLKTESGSLILSSTNLEIAVSVSVRCKIEEQGVVVIPSKTFSEVIYNIFAENITLESQDSVLKISTEKNNFQINTFPAEDFPVIPEPDNLPQTKISKLSLQKAFSQTAFAASKSETQPEISGVLVAYEEGGLRVAATDRYRLAETRIGGVAVEDSRQVIIPPQTVSEILKIVQYTPDEFVVFACNENQLILKTSNTILVSRLIDGQYPDYRHIIPTNHTTSIAVSVSELVAAVKSSAIFSQQTSTISLEAGDEQIVISAISKELGEGVVKVPASVKGDKITLQINFRYLLDVLNSISEDMVNISLIDDNSPVIIKPEGDLDTIYLIMPIKKS